MNQRQALKAIERLMSHVDGPDLVAHHGFTYKALMAEARKGFLVLRVSLGQRFAPKTRPRSLRAPASRRPVER